MTNQTYTPSLMNTSDLPDCNQSTPCAQVPVCPACDGLHTMCRPRFFAGQLLTDEDLNRLDRYIADKNRLHNRHIHGWGVASGLEVTCTVCNSGDDRGKVLVKPGYALSPCGNDIVVAKTESVDMCELINRCLPPQDDCFSPKTKEACKDLEEDWILAICYNEKTARDVAALRTSSSCDEGKHSAYKCGCGGKCGCGDKGNTTKSRPPVANGPNASRAPHCEPTVVCESYSFRAYKIAKPSNQTKQHMGALIRRFVCCLAPFMESLGGLPSQDSSPSELQQWLANLKGAICEFLRREGLYDCEVAQKLDAADIHQPAPLSDSEKFIYGWVTATVSVLQVALLVMKKCMCSALLPPGPEQAMDDCVPIATLTVGRNPCRVNKICNVSSRRFLLTWPNVHYWLSWTPLFGSTTDPRSPRTLRDVLVQMCCTTLVERFQFLAHDSISAQYGLQRGPSQQTSLQKSGENASQQTTQTIFLSLLESALADHKDGADIGTLLLAAMGVSGTNGNPLASALELNNPGEFTLMNQILLPTLKIMFPMSAAKIQGGAAYADEIVALRKELDALRAQMEKVLADNVVTKSQPASNNKKRGA